MEIIISNNANKPIYEQITSQIKAMIMSGELQAGDAIPSMRSLAKSIHVFLCRMVLLWVLSGKTEPEKLQQLAVF